MSSQSQDDQPREAGPRVVNPFFLIDRGNDTMDDKERVLFADFTPAIIPADTPTDDTAVEPEEVYEDPKDESVPEPVPSGASSEVTEQKMLETTVPIPAGSDDGQSNPSENG